ncbi:hypothetical protein H6F43_03920 [Leptolyngbya sp. FACHB-36]|uniref:hypothetical protein n=1 Tax=Leptolyngbya sp. FACHB-36 TaxID=2692808 RepID=UPI001681986D|nr:hypothetical protein [Leptolyngbya sp. FACHB-36]MBD2019330.1 hypothetical protein [Leptolyngbya sp. FACHB-36]
MDPQAIQALMQTLQQAVQILQSAASDTAPGDDDDKDMPQPNAAMDDDGDADDMDDLDKDMVDGDDDGDAATLHDRIAQLEQHTGLKKSANAVPVLERIDALEDHWLGEQYEGAVADRVAQLERVAKLQKSTKPARTQPTDDDAPEVIHLDALIKTAISEGVKVGVREVVSQMQSDTTSRTLPPVSEMRKQASQTRYNQRKAQPPTVQGDAELIKSAQSWGYEDGDLDKPVGLGDVLLAQYHAQQNGGSAFLFDDDE